MSLRISSISIFLRISKNFLSEQIIFYVLVNQFLRLQFWYFC